MEPSFSKTKIDRLGDRLRKGNITDDDLRLLDDYRRTFDDSYEHIVRTIRQQLALEPTGRPAKSTTSIAEKLRRESIRLTQIQDIAGCRLIVPEIATQEGVVASLTEIFPERFISDRRQKPSHGYRAVHVIVSVSRKAVEVQVRTALQHVWAELSEKLSDLTDPAVKYGGGDPDIKELLSEASLMVAKQESTESRILDLQRSVNTMLLHVNLTEERRADIMATKSEIASVEANIAAARENHLNVLRQAIQRLAGK